MKTKRKLASEMEDDFFKQYSVVVYGAVKRLGIWRSHPDYDDHVQEGLVALVDAYETFPERLETEEDWAPFGGYAYQKVRWRLLDNLRRKKKQTDREAQLPEAFDTLFPDTDAVWETDLIEKEWMLEVLHRLNEEEQLYVLDAVVRGKTPTEMARTRGVSRKTIYKRRKRIAEKLQGFLLEWENGEGNEHG
ncbi:sigma-70 family RNA polymerase sigma factor [Atopococcus tabaci]|uniref:sigma-70 family RNA polymerase sigma factor n=1 Tax=Atopococcus tabaci TaxID=269774 RepID=UPI00041A43FD|nr:sigma-70 family RNA polymerase sigma factor [Atopococcus tabaci]